MTKQVVDLGSVIANGADGDTAREAFTKVNANFTEVYDNVQSQTQAVNNKVDKVAGKSLVDDDEIAKLATVNANATQNSADPFLLDRANHTGTQAVSTVSGLQTSLDSKADEASLGTAAFESADSFEKLLSEGPGITIDRTNPLAPVISASGGAGSGDVIGTNSSINGEVVLFDGVNGKVLKGGGVLGTAAFTASTDYATSAQGSKAETAVQPATLADYTPTSNLGSAAFTDSNVYATAAQGVKADSSLQPTVIGTAVQGWSANLDSWSSVAPTAKQDTLVSGTNIKTINGDSILGVGDIEIAGEGGGSPLFSVVWWPSRVIPEGYVAADGQTLPRATYPDAWAGIQAGNVPTVAEATWQSTSTERGKFTVGDGVSTFRLPDYNGKTAGSLGAVFLRGDGALSAEIAGVIQRDAMQITTGKFETPDFNAGTTTPPLTDGAFTSTQEARSSGVLGGTSTINSWFVDFSNANSPNARTASETRTLNVTGCWVVKLFGAVVNSGSADAFQLASDYANLASRVSSLESGAGRTWKSPTRAVSTAYQNTDGLEREVSIILAATSGRTVEVSSDGNSWIVLGETTTTITNHNFTVPHTWRYRVSGGAVVINQWKELSK